MILKLFIFVFNLLHFSAGITSTTIPSFICLPSSTSSTVLTTSNISFTMPVSTPYNSSIIPLLLLLPLLLLQLQLSSASSTSSSATPYNFSTLSMSLTYNSSSIIRHFTASALGQFRMRLGTSIKLSRSWDVNKYA